MRTLHYFLLQILPFVLTACQKDLNQGWTFWRVFWACLVSTWLYMFFSKILDRIWQNKQRKNAVALARKEEKMEEIRRFIEDMQHQVYNTGSQEKNSLEEWNEKMSIMADRYQSLQKEYEKLQQQARKYEHRAIPDDLKLLSEKLEEVKLLKEQVRNLTALNIQNNPLVCSLHEKPRYLSEKEWAELERLVDDVYDGFTKRLASEFTGLTSAELHLCVLLKLRFAHAEIASLLAISASSVSQNKTRLKKHLLRLNEHLLDDGRSLDAWIWEY